MNEPRVLLLELTDRARRAQMMNHATPAVMLVVLGVSALLSGHAEHLWVDILGIVAGVALLILLKREWKRRPHAQHSRVGWYDVIAGIVVMIEGYHKLHPGKWFQPGTLLMLVGVLFILLGVFHHRLAAARRLVCTDDGFALRTRLISSFTGHWTDLKGFALEGHALRIHLVNGQTEKHSLRRVENRLDVLKMLQNELERAQERAKIKDGAALDHIGEETKSQER